MQEKRIYVCKMTVICSSMEREGVKKNRESETQDGVCQELHFYESTSGYYLLACRYSQGIHNLSDMLRTNHQHTLYPLYPVLVSTLPMHSVLGMSTKIIEMMACTHPSTAVVRLHRC